MLRFLFPLFTLLLCTCVRAQNPLTYTTDEGEVHLAGPHSLNDLQIGPYAEWYAENLAEAQLPETMPAWAANLTETDVTIFLGTWCGDSKTWVPRFVALWEALGQDTDRLHFVALYDTDEKYKQGPDSEEVGRGIHRVPTFIFEIDGEEISRIVERPRTDLLTDIAQISLGYPATPRYEGAAYFNQLFEEEPLDSISVHFREHLYAVYRNLVGTGELNTYGNVLRAAGESAKAQIVFRVNASLYRTDPRALKQFAQSVRELGDQATALRVYERALEILPEDEVARVAVTELREAMKTEKN